MGRRGVHPLGLLAATAIVVVTIACNALTGADDLVEKTTNLEEEGSSGSPPGTPGTPGTPGATPDWAVDPNITATLEGCGESGICMPSVSGWSATILLGTEPDCPGAWPDKSDFTEPTGGDCACSCNSDGVCTGNLQVTSGCTGSAVSVPTGDANGSCEGPSPIAIPVGINVLARPAATPNCQVVSTPRFTQEKRTVCGGGARLPATCQRNRTEACVPLPGSPGARSCVIHDGDAPCPGGLPFRAVVGAGDQRQCAGCECKSNCGTAIFYSGGSCNGTARTVIVDGTCQSGTPVSAISAKYTATNGCTPKAPTAPVTGGFATTKTICCTDPK